MGAARYWGMSLIEWRGSEITSYQSYTEPVSAYNYAVEFRTEEDLQLLISDPDEMRMQALLLREKILGPVHPDTSYYIRYRGAVYADSGDFVRCIRLWKYALVMQRKHLEPLSQLTQSSFLSFAELFSFMATDQDRFFIRLSSPAEFFNDLLVIFNYCILEIKSGKEFLDKNTTTESPKKEKVLCFNRYLIIVLHIASLVIKHIKENDIEEKDLKKFTTTFDQLTALNIASLQNNQNLLHIACSKENSSVGRYPICNFPNISLLSILLEAGLSPTKPDKNGYFSILISYPFE